MATATPQTRSAKRKGAFPTISFPLLLCVCGGCGGITSVSMPLVPTLRETARSLNRLSQNEGRIVGLHPPDRRALHVLIHCRIAYAPHGVVDAPCVLVDVQHTRSHRAGRQVLERLISHHADFEAVKPVSGLQIRHEEPETVECVVSRDLPAVGVNRDLDLRAGSHVRSEEAILPDSVV